MKDNISTLYGALKNQGYTDIGKDETEFRNWLGQEGNVKTLYSALSQQGFDDIGDEQQFTDWVGLSPKQPEVSQEQVTQRILENKPDYFKPKKVDLMLGSVDKDKTTFDLMNEGRAYELDNIRKQRPITEFGEAFEQGTDALYQGGKNLVGETANVLTGSQLDYDRARRQLDELVASGYDLNNFDAQKALKDYKDRDFQRRMIEWQQEVAARREEREDMGFFESMLHKIKDPSRPKSQYEATGMFADELQLERSYHAIQDALNKSNGNIEEAYKLLGEKASKETWGDKTTREAREKLAEQRETKGFGAWVGSMIPQMIGTGAGLAVSLTPWGRAARFLGQANMMALTGATAGMSMAEARDYAKRKGLPINEGDIWRAGVVDAAIEYGTEYIPFTRYFNHVGDASNKFIGKYFANSVKGNSQAKKEFASLLDGAAKDFKLKYFSKDNIERYLTDVVTEGLSEFSAEALQTLSPIIYQNPEDYPTLMEILENGFEGAKGGLFMGAFLGAGSTFAGTYHNRRRREKQGGVTLANTANNGVVEIVGKDEEGIHGLTADGDGVVLKDEDILEQRNYTLEEFDKAAKEKVMSDAEERIQADNESIDAATDTQTGNYAQVTAILPDGVGGTEEVVGNVVGWIGDSPIFVADGMENTEENRIVLKQGEWNPETLIERPAEEVKVINEEMVREEVAAQAEMESKYAPEVLNKQMEQGIPFETADAVYLPIQPMAEGNGWTVEVQPKATNNKTASKSEVIELTNDEFYDLLQADLEAQEALQAEIAQSESVGEQVNAPVNTEVNNPMETKDSTPMTPMSSPMSEEVQSATEEKSTQPVIPTKKDGSIDYVAYGKENSLKDLGNQYGEKLPNKVSITAKAYADDLIAAQAKLDKAQEAVDNAPIGRETKQKKALEEAENAYNEAKKEADFWAEMDADIKAAQEAREALVNPKVEVDNSNEPLTADEFVAQQLAAGNIVLTSESFKKETGYGEKERKKFPKLFRKAENGGMTIEEAGERLMEMDRENGTNFFDQTDANAGRDALIDMLGSVRTWGDITGYIRGNREYQAQRESEGLRNEIEEAIEANYHMTPEEYATLQEVESVENPFGGLDVATKDAIFVEAYEEYEQSLNPKQNDEGRTSEIAEGNGDVLSEERTDNEGGTSERQGERPDVSEGAVQQNDAAQEAEQVEEPLTIQKGESPVAFAERVVEEQRRKPLRNRANEWAKALGVKVTFLESIDEVDPVTRVEIEDAHKKGDSVPGWVARNGEVYFFMPDLRDVKDVDETYVHEVVAHIGMEKLLGKERFAELCDKVWEMMPQSAKDYYYNYPGVNSVKDEATRKRKAADEYIAHLAEQENLTPEEKTIWDNIVKMFRDMLDKALNGIIGKSKLTDKDISDLIKASYANLKSGAEGGVSGDGTRFNAKRTSDRRQEINRMNNTVDQAVSFVTGKDIKEVKAERVEREQKRKEDAAEIYQSVLSGDFNDVTLRKINDYIDDATPLHPYGRRISQRLPQKLERGLHEGARTNAVDALFSRICESAVPASRRASEAGRREIEERKKEALKGWAIATNNWHTDLSDFADEEDFIRQGTDSKVYLAKDGRHVIKVSFGKPEGKRFRPDIDTTALFNSVFRNTAYEIVGYGEFDGKFARILKQPFVDFADNTALNAEELEEYMRTLGFEPINESNTAFSNGTIIAADLQKSNILKDAAGNISVIDADMKLHTKDVGGNYTYPPVEADLPNNTSFRVVKDKNGKKTLVGLHNISEEKLRKAIKQGGLANPSMAVIDMDKQSHVDYGDITLVAPESLVDKKFGKNIGTYMADAYTPIYPTVVKQMTDKGYKVFNNALDDVNEVFRSKVRSYFKSYLDSGTVYDALYYWYLSDTGKNPPTLEAALPSDFTREEVDKVKSINPEADSFFQLSEEDKQKALAVYADKFYGGIEKYQEYLADYINRMREVVKDESKPAMVRNRIQRNLNEIENYGFEYDYVAAYYNRGMTLANRQSKPSDVETFSNARNEVIEKGLTDEFKQWLAEKEADFGVEEKLFKGYDNQGRAKYVPNTLENASKLMKKEGRAGATGYGGFNEFVAVLAPVAKTTKELNKKKQNLSTKEAYDEFVEQWSGYYHDLAQKLQPGADKWADYGYHRLQEIAPMANPRDYVKREYGIELSDEFMKDLNDIKTAIKNDFPARYFETKFERPVYLNEFAAAVVPQGTSKDVVDALTEAGLQIEEYERGNNEARMAAVDKVSSETEGVRFRVIQSQVDEFTSKYNSKPVVVIESSMTDKELETLTGGDVEELREAIEKDYIGSYDPKTDKIYIFADNASEEAIESALVHENLHELFRNTEFIDEFNKNSEGKFNQLRDWVDKHYPQSRHAEELFVHVADQEVYTGEFKYLPKYLSEDSFNKVNEILDKFGYGKESKDGTRTRGRILPEGNRESEEDKKHGSVGQERSSREQAERLRNLFERVAEEGLRGVVGNTRYDLALIDVFHALPDNERVDVSINAVRNLGGDVAAAVDEYLNEKDNPTLWEKVAGIIRDMLRRSGFDLDLTQNDVKYLLWRSKKPLDRSNLVDMAEDIYKKYQLKVGEYSTNDDGTTPDGGGTRFRRVYHGSSASFDKFDHSFMGTGEGNQSFGWGSYVTDVKEVGEKYAGLKADNSPIASQTLRWLDENPTYEAFITKGEGARRKKTIANAKEFLKEMKEDGASEDVINAYEQDLKDAERAITEDGYNQTKENMIASLNRHLYEVEIPDDNGSNYIAWDKMLPKEQAERIKDAIRNSKFFKEYEKDYKQLAEERLDAWTKTNGGRAYKLLGNIVWNEKDLSQILSEAGFSGFKYPTNYFSGGNEDGTNNYVIFNEDDLEIMDHTRFRVANKLQVRDEYEAIIRKGGYQAREAVQDAMLSLRRFQELIEKESGKKLKDFENAWMHENRLSSVVQAAIHEMERKYYKPMMESVKKLMKAADIKQEEVADYLMLKHGIERNREMAVRKALTDAEGKIDRAHLEQWYQDKEAIRNDASLDTWRKKQEAMDNLALNYGADMSRDYSGLTSMFDTDDIEECTNRAYDEVEALENAYPAETEALGKAVKAMTQNTLDESFRSGLMDRKVYDELSKDMYDYYIPLRGFEETTSEEVYAYLDQDRGAFNAPLQRAKGRSSKSDNPIAYLKSIAESGIMQGERNKMKQSFLNMVINHPSDLVSIHEGVWVVYNPASGEWEAVAPPAIPNNATPADVEAAMEAWEQQMEQAAQNDPTLVKKVAEAADVPYRVVGNRMNQHQIIVKRLGKSYTLTVNGNPRLAMALNGLTNPNNTSNDGKVSAYVSGKFGALNRFLASVYTTKNPDFIVSNFMRDTFYTNTIVRAKEGNSYANKFHKHYAELLMPGKMISLFKKYEKGTLDMSNATEAAFKDFMMNGGETGYSNLKDLENIKKQIAKDLKGNRLEVVEKVAEKLDILNRAVENTARFAAYLTSREDGRSVAKSVFDAKEISVNFNKKGAGGTFFGMTGQTKLGNLAAMVGAGGRALYVFFNAAIQGTTNLLHVMKKSPKGTSAGIAAMFLMGAVLPFLLDDDEEKDYYDLPEHVRRNHLILPGFGDAWISIPLPIEYRIMYGMGELLTSWRTGHERGSDIGRKMLNLTGQALPLNFLEEGFDAFIPSSLSPLWQVYNNKSWTGLPLYKDNEFNKDDPEYTKAYKNVDRTLYNVTKALYDWTFDEENQEAGINLNPAVLEALARGYFGGFATQLGNLGKTWEIIAGEREFDWRSIPIGNRVFKSGDERTKEKRITNEYFENMEKLDFMQSRERTLKKTINGVSVPQEDKDRAKEDYDRMKDTDIYKKYQEFKKKKKDVDKLRKRMKEKGSTEELEKELTTMQEEANKVVR